MAPQSRAEAIAKIRALAEAGRVSMQRRAQARMEALGYNVNDVEDCLCDLREAECTKDSTPEHPEFGEGGWVYEFVTDFFGEPPLYVKVYLYPDSVYVLSFKIDGSPA